MMSNTKRKRIRRDLNVKLSAGDTLRYLRPDAALLDCATGYRHVFTPTDIERIQKAEAIEVSPVTQGERMEAAYEQAKDEVGTDAVAFWDIVAARFEKPAASKPTSERVTLSAHHKIDLRKKKVPTPKPRTEDLVPGILVEALVNIDPEGTNVDPGDVGFVFGTTNCFGDGAGPIVQWLYARNGRIEINGSCNVYEGQVRVVSDSGVFIIADVDEDADD